MSEEEKLRLVIRQELTGRAGDGPGMLKLWAGVSLERQGRLKEVLAIIRPERWIETKTRMQRLRLPAFTQTRVLGRGRERGLRYLPRQGASARTGMRYLPKRMISWIVEESQVEPLIQAILEVSRIGQLGDGKIFVLPVEEAVRIRTGERGIEALNAQQFEMVIGTPRQCARIVEEAHASRQ